MLLDCLPFVGQVWQVYVLIFFLYAAAAGSPGPFRAVVLDILQDEEDYSKYVSPLRRTVDLE